MAVTADVIVVGAGNAAFCAALAAQEQGAKVVMLEAAPEEESGGNSRFTAGSIRVVYNGVDDIKTLVPDLTPAEIETTDFGTYTADQFFDESQFESYRALGQHIADRTFPDWRAESNEPFDATLRRLSTKIWKPNGADANCRIS